MSDRYTITAEPRVVVGKKVKQLRRDGWVPAVIYGQQDPVNVQIEAHPLFLTLREAGTTTLIDVEIEGENRTVLAREIQQHLTRGDLIHVDFMEVDMAATITSEAVLVMVGESTAAEEGLGAIALTLQSVEIECLPENLVSEIEVDISQIASTSDVLHVGDLTAPEGVTILTDPDTVMARFAFETLIEEEEEEEMEMGEVLAEDVEIIEKGKGEEEEE
ncbi:MAG: 50S ribosomal protein L25 [Chloroflexi bacterium]|nr:50S ribosomal protein L25 [Chloroflexota bacterium]